MVTSLLNAVSGEVAVYGGVKGINIFSLIEIFHELHEFFRITRIGGKNRVLSRNV